MDNSAKLIGKRNANRVRRESRMTPNGTKTYKIQSEIFNLDTFENVLVGKEYQFAAVATTQDALARLGNDANLLIKVINDGLRAEEQRKLRDEPTGWFEFDDEGKLTDKPFSGTLADDKKVNALVLTLAKTVFGYNKDMTADQKNAARDSARDMIRNTPAILEGLKKSAAMGGSEANDEA